MEEQATQRERARRGSKGPRDAEAKGLRGSALDQRSATFLHEVSNLVDGSLRSLRLARRDLDASADEEVVTQAMRRLEAAESALAHITELIAALRTPEARTGAMGKTGGRFALLDPEGGLPGAIRHAVDVLRPMAEERGVRLMTETHTSLASAPMMPLYAVVNNAVRNAIEAIGSMGSVTVRAVVLPEPADGIGPGGRASLVIEVIDDGPGPGVEALERAFDFGFTTKMGSSGIGLALAREIVRRLGGEVTLTEHSPGAARPGAALRVVIPFALTDSPTTGGRGAKRA